MLESRRFANVVFCVMSGMLILPHVARSQALNGSVVGNIKDPSGAGVPGAAVTLTGNATGVTRATVADTQGGYNFATVQPGVYSIRVTKGGFAALVQSNIIVTADEITRADEELTVGGVNQTVQVEAEAAVLQTDTSQVSTEMSSEAMANMPTYIGRNFQNLLVTVPGVTNVISNSHSVGTNPSRAMQYYVNGGGQSYEQNDTRVDGASIKNMWERDILALVPTLEAVETVNVTTSNFEADTGFVGGASTRVQSKSGTNAFHGALFEGYSGNKLETRPFFLPAGQSLGKIVYHEFGAAAGYKIIKDKLFWYGSYEGHRDHEFDSVASGAGGSLLTVPDALQRAGNFSESSTAMYDPMTGASNGTGRTPFPSNQIPTSRMSPIALQLQSLLPLPNVAGASITNNFAGAGPYFFDSDHADGKLNWNPTPKLTLFTHFGIVNWIDEDSSVFGCQQGVNPATCLGGQDVNTQGGQPGHSFGITYELTNGFTYLLRPNLILDGYVAFEHDATSVEPFQTGLNLGQTLGIPGTNGSQRYQSGWPLFTIGSSSTYAPLGDWFSQTGGSPYYRYDHQHQYIANLDWVKGKHDIRFGSEIDQQYLNNLQSGTAQGAFTFGSGPTQLSGGPSGNQFNDYASFLLGLVTSAGNSAVVDNPAAEPAGQHWYSANVSDRWQVTPKLTATLGVRWDYYGFPNAALRPAAGYNIATNEAIICSEGSNPKNCGASMPNHLFSPRLGLAYRVTDTLVIRAGYGINWLPQTLANTAYGYYPTNISAAYTSPNSYSYYGSLSQGIPAITLPTISNGLTNTNGSPLLPVAVSGTQWPNHTIPWPYAQNMNVTAQKQFGDFSAQVGWVANHTIRATQTLNENVDYQINTGTAGLPFEQNGYGKSTSVNIFYPNGNTMYQSMQSSLNRRMKAGLLLGAAWTWSKSEASNFDVSPLVTQYQYLNTRPVVGTDRTNTLVVNVAWQFPFGKNKAFSSSKVANAILGGWTLNSLGTFETGEPFSISCSSTSLNMSGASQLCYQNVGNVTKSGSIGGAYFNPLAFSPVTTASFGYVQPGILRGPGIANIDSALQREFRIKERWVLQFRADVYNLMNHPAFANPGGNVSNLQLNPDGSVKNLAGYAQVTNVINTGRDQGNQRDMRFSMHISF
jgi:Carboxypeptidase regulatory-like domain/TonB dependent receptor